MRDDSRILESGLILFSVCEILKTNILCGSFSGTALEYGDKNEKKPKIL